MNEDVHDVLVVSVFHGSCSRITIPLRSKKEMGKSLSNCEWPRICKIK